MVRTCLRLLVLLVSITLIASFGYAALHHLLDLSTNDATENAILDGGQRIALGQPLYDESSLTGNPLPMPGYAIVARLMTGGEELRLWHVRMLALGVALSLALVIATLVQLESASWTLALASGSFVLISLEFPPGLPGAARPEIFMLLLVILGFSMLRFTQGIWGALLAALLFGAAYFVDQQTGWFMAAAYFSIWLDENRGRLLVFTMATGLLVGGGFLFLSYRLGPWFNFNAWDEPLALLRFNVVNPLRYVADHLLSKLGVWTLAALLACAMPTQPWEGKRGIWMCLAVAAVVAGLYATQSTAFGPRSLVPGMVVLSLMGPLMVHRVARHLSMGSDPDLPSSEGVVVAALALQFLVLLNAVPLVRWLPDFVHSWHRNL